MKYTRENIEERAKRGEALEYVFFWGHHAAAGVVTKACFSQWFPCEFIAEGQVYNCAEQYMMAEKARVFGDEDVRQQILASRDPKEIKALGRLVKNFDAGKWAQVAKDIVVSGNAYKFSQNPELRAFLLGTENKILVEASPYDTIWGIGMEASDPLVTTPSAWKGTNHLGFALMEVRDELKHINK